MIYHGSSDTKYLTIDDNVRRGGEGSIYQVSGKPSILLKIYHDDMRTGMYEKVIVISEHAAGWSPNFRAYTVPPLEIVNDENGSFAGYAMKKLDKSFVSLNAVYDATVGKNISYPNKVITAKNLCVITKLAHDSNVIIGDYNQKNIGVTPEGQVFLFDNDSFQISRGNKVYRCVVGVQEEMAPEILRLLKKEKADLRTVSTAPYNKSTDNYTLALHIFHLLMNGAHPFNSEISAADLPESKTISAVTLPITAAALKAKFTFAEPTVFRKPPKWAPSYAVLGKELQTLFERAFIDGLNSPEKRPTPEEWFTALDNYAKNLKKLSCGHYQHKDYNGKCEWCRIENI